MNKDLNLTGIVKLVKKSASLDQRVISGEEQKTWLCRVWFNFRKPRNQKDELEELLPVNDQESDL